MYRFIHINFYVISVFCIYANPSITRGMSHSPSKTLDVVQSLLDGSENLNI